MKTLWNRLMTDESGVILSAELILILTIAVLGLVTGLACLQQAIVGEFQDLALAFGGLNQSYATPSFRGCRKWWGPTSWTAGSGFIDFNRGWVGTSGATPVGWGGGFASTGGLCEINSGVGCNSIATPSCNPSPGVLAPQPIPAPATTPCDGCLPGSEVVIPTPATR